MIDAQVRRRQRVRNVVQALLLLGGMVTVLAALAWLLLGASGLVWVLILAGVLLAFRPNVPKQWMLSMYGARALPPHVAPSLHRWVRVLAQRAGLPGPPDLYYVPTSMTNAFAVGRPDDAALAVTDGLLRRLSSRELIGVLAHEISHIRANDLWIMSLSDTLGRITHALAYFGMVLAVLTLPYWAAGSYRLLLVALVLTLLPTVVTLLQLALSRSREYDADLEAASLTGDPEGLARALMQIERSEGPIWERILVPHRRTPDPLLLRTHPPTEERVRRLRALTPPAREPLADGTTAVPYGYPRVTVPVRLRPPGIRW